ncbi:MAG: ribonuclease HI [Candidatus Taylorbacteria bacterium]|nr:ribonuclease HI [Candidatus Taylorbacteria bacterium]
MRLEKVIIFTDGAARGNPGPGGWGGIIAVGDNAEFKNFKNQKSKIKIAELGGREINTTNNRMELTAAIKALEYLSSLNLESNSLKLTAYADSKYLINGITKWLPAWRREGWRTAAKEEVMNRDLWEQLLVLTANFEIDWQYVGGHAGVAGNERCDRIAAAFADGEKLSLYSGPAESYSINILDLGQNDVQVARKARRGGQAYAYLSLADGVFVTHGTWAECEKRVKGKKGAKYRRAETAEDVEKIKKAWGV